MLSSQRNSKKQGDVGLGMAIGWLSSKGYTISIPLTDSQDYDLIVDIDGKLNRVQVKTTYHRNNENYWQLDLRVCGGNKSGQKMKHFDPTLVEYVFALCEDGTMYFIPCTSITNKSTITFGGSGKYDSFRITF